MIRGWDPMLPGWRWLYALKPISDRPMGLAFPHRAGRFDTGEFDFHPRFAGVVNIWKDF